MTTVRNACIAAALASLAFAAPAEGQTPVCEDTEMVEGCFERLLKAVTTAGRSQSAASSAEENEELNGKATGPNLNENLAQSAIRDFLPRFAGSFITSDPTKDLRAVDFRFNTPMGRNGSGPRLTLQGGVTVHAAELYAPLVDSIPGSIREASRDRLEKELEDGDDATGFITLNPESRRVGRDFANHQQTVDALAATIRDSALVRIGPPPAAVGAFGPFSLVLGDTLSIRPDRRTDPACMVVTEQPKRPRSTLPVSCLTDQVRTEMETLFTPMTRYTGALELTIGMLLTNSGFDRISDLVNNQPQVNVSAEYRSRLGVVGPNEWTGRLRWERGFYNMNGLRTYCRARLNTGTAQPPAGAEPTVTASEDTSVAAPAPADPVTLACLDGYTTEVATPERMARGDRLWIAAEVRYRPEYDISLPEDSVAFSLDTGVGFGISGGYGRYLGSAEEDEDDRDRIDLHVSYDFADGEDLRQRRILAGVFYTLRINANASGVVGLAWANKPEFVGGADRQLGANFGLSYKFNRGKTNGQD